MLRPFLTYLAILSGLSAGAQQPKKSSVLYVADIPLIVEAHMYVESDRSDIPFMTLDNNLIVRLPARGEKIAADHIFKIATALPKDQLNKVEVKRMVDGVEIAGWTPINGLAGGIVVDTAVKFIRSLQLEFRDRRNASIIQRSVFERFPHKPVILAYRSLDHLDSLGEITKSRALKNTSKPLMGFQLLSTKRLLLEPGKQLEIQIRKASINMDSCLEYRLAKPADRSTARWVTTGHLLSLSGLLADTDYILDIRYKNADAFESVDIFTGKYWYQTGTGHAVLIISGITTLLLAPFAVYRYALRKERNEKNRIHERLRTVQAQLNPHFVYNALASIEGLIAGNENTRANEYLTNFSQIMRHTLKSNHVVLTSLGEDIAMLEKYIQIEQLRFEFRYEITIDPGLDLDAIEFPPLLLQPSVENAVKHGLAGMGSEGILRLRYSKEQTDLAITITDNGEPCTVKIPGEGYGTRHTKERITQLQKLYKREKMSYEFQPTEQGFIARFIFKNWLA